MTQSCYIGTCDIRNRVIRGSYCMYFWGVTSFRALHKRSMFYFLSTWCIDTCTSISSIFNNNLCQCIQLKDFILFYALAVMMFIKREGTNRIHKFFLRTLDDPIWRHFNSDAHNGEITQIKVYILAFITPPSNSSDALQMRLRVENSWIYRLWTSLPLGLNTMD